MGIAVFGACLMVATGGLYAWGRATPAGACTGGVAPLEWFAPRAELIVIGEAVLVGGAENAAPTVTATSTPTATSTAAGRSPTVAPYPSVSPSPTRAPLQYNLAGFGVTLAVERALAGPASATVDLDWASRAGIERELREAEGAPQGYISSCPIGAFVPRWELGRRYLVFAEGLTHRPHVVALFPLEGSQVILGDPVVAQANNGILHMEAATYERFFAGIPVKEYGETIYLTEGRVPLSAVLRAVAALRGDPSIAPPDTGSAGLAARR